MRYGLRSLVVGVSLAVAGCGSAAADEPGPVELVRTLELLQDSIAQGTGAPDDARRKLIGVVGDGYLSADADVWSDERNADAALLFVLNGGSPVVLTRLPESPEGSARGKLIAAVAAYAIGSRAAAVELWEDVELATLPKSLSGPAALAQVNLLMESNPERALRFADIARLESPGTLVDEAATRRGMELAARLGKSARFEFYAVSYVTRFPDSPYSAAFRDLLSRSYLTLASRADIEETPELDAVLALLPVKQQVEMYLDTARRAVVAAEMALAKTVAESALELARPDTMEMRRAELYKTAAHAFEGDPVVARARLEDMRTWDLPSADGELLNAVLSIVLQIQRWPLAEDEPPSRESRRAMAGDNASPVDQIVTRAEAVMVSATQALEEAEY